MRVLHAIETLGVGGAERVLVQLLPALREAGVDSEVAVLRGPYTLAGEIEAAGFTVHRLEVGNLWNLPGGARALARLAKARGCGVIHANLLFPTVYTAMAKRLFARDLKTLTTFHNLAYAPGANRRGATYGLRKRLNRWSVSHGMDARLAVSGAVAEHYAAALGARDVRVIHNPVAVDAALAAVEGKDDAWPLPDEGSAARLILPGRYVHEKGHADLIEALALLAARGTRFATVFAGDGPLRDTLAAQIAKTGLAIHMTGPIPRAEFLRLVRASDIAVIPSRYEGFGLTAAEALVMRRGVIATRIGGLTDIVRDDETGVLVPDRDPAALAEAIAALAADPQRRARLGEVGHAHVRAHFDAPVVAARLAEIYRAL